MRRRHTDSIVFIESFAVFPDLLAEPALTSPTKSSACATPSRVAAVEDALRGLGAAPEELARAAKAAAAKWAATCTPLPGNAYKLKIAAATIARAAAMRQRLPAAVEPTPAADAGRERGRTCPRPTAAPGVRGPSRLNRAP